MVDDVIGVFFFFQAEDGIRGRNVTGVQTCALPICFAVAYLAGVVAAGLAYTLLDPDAQARLIAWASTNVANLEHEPVGPLLVSAFVTSGFFAAWPALIAPAVFGANRALGNTRTAL